MRYLYAKQFYFTDEKKGAGYLPILDDGTFGPYQVERPDKGEVIDYGDFSIAPGLVDTHIHGYQGHDVMDNSLEALEAMSAGLPACGVTSYLPTTLTAPREQLDAVCQTIGEHAGSIDGAKIQGIFLEGPFFSEAYKGAQNPSYMCDPEFDYLERWQDLAKGWVKKIALAPERQGSIAFIEQAKSRGIYCAIAHSDATYEDCRQAVEAGANIFVHTYNGMRGLHHREPGVVGSALVLGQYDELICDGHHVHPVSASLVMKAAGSDKTVLITDCMRAGGLGDCESTLGEFSVLVKDGAARLKHNGSLAGSILELIQGVRNVVKWGIASPEEALKMASYAPAASVGLDHICGRIDPGYAADCIVLDDDLSLKATYINGDIYYTSLTD